MSHVPTRLPVLTPEQRRTVAEHFQHANHWLAKGEPQKALPFLRSCFQLDPDDLVGLKTLHAARAQLKIRASIFTALQRRRISRHMNTALSASDWPAALADAQDLLDLDPANLEAHRALARAFEALDLLDHAVWCLEQTMNLGGQGGTELPRLYERTGRFSQARTLNDQRPVVDPAIQTQISQIRERLDSAVSEPSGYIELSRLYRGASDFAAARDWLERGLTATKNDFQVLLELADLNLQILRQDAAIADERLASNPEDAELKAIRTRLRHEINARELDQLRQRADRQPNDFQLRMELGALLLKNGQFEAALDEFQPLYSDPTHGWRARVYSGYCHLNIGNRRRAKAVFEEALPHIPQDAEETRNQVLALLGGTGVAPIGDTPKSPRPGSG